MKTDKSLLYSFINYDGVKLKQHAHTLTGRFLVYHRLGTQPSAAFVVNFPLHRGRGVVKVAFICFSCERTFQLLSRDEVSFQLL